MGKLLTLALVAAGIAPAEPDGLLVMGVVGREGSASAVHGERAMVADPRTGAVRTRVLPGGTLCYGVVTSVAERVLYQGHRGNRSVTLTLPLSLRGAPRSIGETRSRTSPLRTTRDGWLVAAARSGIAWCGPGCRSLHVRSRGRERRFEPPPGFRLRTGHGALSPHGSRLAVPVTGDGGPRIAVLDFAAGSWTVVPGGELRGYEATAWSPSGGWLYFTGPNQRLFGWELGSEAAVRLPVNPRGAVMSIDMAG